jgi:hypothetical protein
MAMTTADRIDALIARIDRLALVDDEIDVSWGAPSTPEAISMLETALRIRLPESFVRFQRRTGGGGPDGLSISTIPREAPLGGVGTVYGDTLHYREPWRAHALPAALVVIQRDPDDNEPFCLDTSRFEGDECPVVLFYHQSSGSSEIVADSFVGFYERYLQPYFEEAGL